MGVLALLAWVSQLVKRKNRLRRWPGKGSRGYGETSDTWAWDRVASAEEGLEEMGQLKV